MNTQIKISFKIFFVMTILTGIIYPLFVTLIGQTIYPAKANGSFISIKNKIVGSELIGQEFLSDKYFHSRPSAINYNPMPSGGTNLSVTSAALKEKVKKQAFLFDSINQIDKNTKIPSEMLYASASGLDPHISIKSANLQISRICKARNFSESQKQMLIKLIINLSQNRQFGFLGEERINVLKLNIELDKIK